MSSSGLIDQAWVRKKLRLSSTATQTLFDNLLENGFDTQYLVTELAKFDDLKSMAWLRDVDRVALSAYGARVRDASAKAEAKESCPVPKKCRNCLKPGHTKRNCTEEPLSKVSRVKMEFGAEGNEEEDR